MEEDISPEGVVDLNRESTPFYRQNGCCVFPVHEQKDIL